MISFTATIHKFGDKGEKSGWTYIDLPAHLAQELRPDIKTAYRVKGTLDDYPIRQVALVPMGEGNFIIAINATMRKGLRKKEGAQIKVAIEVDESAFEWCQDLLDCIAEEPKAQENFYKMPPSHQKYYSNWVEAAKTLETKTKRIVQAVQGLAMGMDYGAMIRHFKAKKDS